MTDTAFWDRIAPKYARQTISDMDAYEATLDNVRSYLTPTDRVLELGCGTGGSARRLAPSVAEMVATDLSPGMIAIARERDPEGLATYHAAGAQEPVVGAPFDAVCAFNLLHLVPDLTATLARIHGLIAPGGLFFSKTGCVQEMGILPKIFIPAMRLVGKAPKTILYLDRAGLERSIVEAGFEIVEHRHFGKETGTRYIFARRR